jgi:hypothetical protein
MGFAQPVWNFTELQELLSANCQNTFMVLEELKAGNQYDVWIDLNMPW